MEPVFSLTTEDVFEMYKNSMRVVQKQMGKGTFGEETGYSTLKAMNQRVGGRQKPSSSGQTFHELFTCWHATLIARCEKWQKC